MRFVRPTLTVLLVTLLMAIPAQRAMQAQGTEPAKVVTPALDFSGVIYAYYQRRTDSSSKAVNGGMPGSKFDIERVYLNFRMPAGDRASIRVTTDIFNNTDPATSGYYKGWTARLKFAYLQWAFANDIAGVKGLNASARFGMLPTVLIDQLETYFPRFYGPTDLEGTAKFFVSADVGGALTLTLPHKMGEFYGTIVNGNGYNTAESDRFKDIAACLTLTPFANGNALGAWGKTLVITPWASLGQSASKFQNGGAGQVGMVPEGLTRDRYGLYIATKDPRLTVALDYGKRTETVESGNNTAASPRVPTDVTGRIMSGFFMVRPAAFADPKSKAARWGVLARIDDFKPDVSAQAGNQFTVLSLFYEPTPKVTFSLDNQVLSRKNGSTTPETKTLFLHVQAAF